MSGLAAAKYYRDRFGAGRGSSSSIRSPTSGATPTATSSTTRTPRRGSDVMMLRNGGAVNLDSPRTWGEPSGAFLDVPRTQAALDLLDYLGIDLDAFPSGRPDRACPAATA